jgi:hypothetical protein
MRKYQPVWIKVRTKGSCCVKVHKLIVSRVVKAVIKEKDTDVAFKMANPLDKPYLSMQYDELVDGKTVLITFRLKQRYGLVSLKQPEEIEL